MDRHDGPGPVRSMLDEILAAGRGIEDRPCRITGDGDLLSAFAVTDLAAASIAAAGLAVERFLRTADGHTREVSIDRRLASMWFGFTLRPLGWEPPPPWDPIAGDYEARDGWIRLHTNAPAHREAALRVLGVPAQPDRVRTAVATWEAVSLESAVVAAGGCAAAAIDSFLRSSRGLPAADGSSNSAQGG